MVGDAGPDRDCVPAAVTEASDPWLSIRVNGDVPTTSDLNLTLYFRP